MSPGYLILWIFLGVLESTGSYNPSSRSNAGFPDCHLMFGSGNLYLFPSVSGRSISDDGWAKHQSFNIRRLLLVTISLSPLPVIYGSILCLCDIQVCGTVFFYPMNMYYSHWLIKLIGQYSGKNIYSQGDQPQDTGRKKGKTRE